MPQCAVKKCKKYTLKVQNKDGVSYVHMDDQNDYNDHMACCPFNPLHFVKRSRLQVHIIKCQKNYPLFAICPYNAIHRFPEHKMKDHFHSCPNKPIIPEISDEQSSKCKSYNSSVCPESTVESSMCSASLDKTSYVESVKSEVKKPIVGDIYRPFPKHHKSSVYPESMVESSMRSASLDKTSYLESVKSEVKKPIVGDIYRPFPKHHKSSVYPESMVESSMCLVSLGKSSYVESVKSEVKQPIMAAMYRPVPKYHKPLRETDPNHDCWDD